MRVEHVRGWCRGGAGGLGVVLAATIALIALPVASAGAQQADDPADLMQGMEVFNGGCSSCHRADGTGSAAGRSLIDIATEQPDRSVHVESVTNGLGNMPAYGDRLTAEEIDAAVTYVRLTFVSDDNGIDQLPETGGEAALVVVGMGLVLLGTVLLMSPAVRHARLRSTS